MALISLRISNLRNIRSVEIDPSPGLNIIWGANGSGKTSLLEAIYMLGRGKSFRSSRAGPVITREETALELFGRTRQGEGKHAIGIRKSASETLVRIDQNPIYKLSELARITPLQIITPRSHEILERGPEYRRRFIEWGVFHVEHQYQEIYRRFNKALLQRNSALRQDPKTVSAWDREFAESGEQLDLARQRYFQQFREKLEQQLAVLTGGLDVSLSWRKGWPGEMGLKEQLEENQEKDLERGFTTAGPHRADMVMQLEGQSLIQKASRGMQKMLIAAMQLAQAEITRKYTGRSPILLIDDLASELDRDNRDRLVERLKSGESQVFLTGTEVEWIEDPSEFAMFHVEHLLNS